VTSAQAGPTLPAKGRCDLAPEGGGKKLGSRKKINETETTAEGKRPGTVSGAEAD
jgi:hypothetical protein